MSNANLIEAVGMTAAIGITLIGAICIWANFAFKRKGVPAADEEEN